MDGLRTYILSVVASAILCACISLLAGKKSSPGKVISALCGIYMAIAIILPISDVDFSGYTDYFNRISLEADGIVADGKDLAKSELATIIKEKSQAYVLDKAVSLGAVLSVDVTLDRGDIPAPVGITLKGAVSPYVKKVLSQYIADELGVPKEAQVWR